MNATTTTKEHNCAESQILLNDGTPACAWCASADPSNLPDGSAAGEQADLLEAVDAISVSVEQQEAWANEAGFSCYQGYCHECGEVLQEGDDCSQQHYALFLASKTVQVAACNIGAVTAEASITHDLKPAVALTCSVHGMYAHVLVWHGLESARMHEHCSSKALQAANPEHAIGLVVTDEGSATVCTECGHLGTSSTLDEAQELGRQHLLAQTKEV
jgi:hypothetical protein